MSMAVKYAMQKRGKKMAESCEDSADMAEGGMAEEKESGYGEMPDEDSDPVGRAMKKRYSKGGMVANETPITADFEDNEFDDLVKRDDLESSYTGADSGDEIGDKQEDDDRKDIVSRVMKSRAKKDRMPRPA